MVSIVYDNFTNMDVVMRALDIPHLGCAGHSMQLRVNDGLKLPKLLKILSRCHNTVAYFHRSVLANDALQKHQKLGNPNKKPLSLIQDVSTWWNSTYSRTSIIRTPWETYNPAG